MKSINKKQDKGFIILLAVVLTSIILAITVGISSIAYREVLLSRTATDAQASFSSADSGAECALLNDVKAIPSLFSVLSPIISCQSTDIDVEYSSDAIGDYAGFSMSTPSGCSDVRVYKNLLIDIGDEADVSVTQIESRGYNLSCAIVENEPENTRITERLIQVRYRNPVIEAPGGDAGGGGGLPDIDTGDTGDTGADAGAL